MGFLAVSPTAPSTAIALSLLQFLHTFWQHSPLAIAAFSKALWAHHCQRGGVYYAKDSLNVSNIQWIPTFDALLICHSFHIGSETR